MNKSLLISLFLVLFLIPAIAHGQTYSPGTGIVSCGNGDPSQGGYQPCGFSDFFNMLAVIYDFIVKWIAVPLAIAMITIAGIILLASGGNPGMTGLGKKILWTSIIGLFLALCSWVIINFILCTVLQYCSWANL